MFILDEPFVSDLLKKSVAEFQIPVLKTAFSTSLNLPEHIPLLDKSDFINAFNNNHSPILYSNSENAIGWVSKNLGFTGFPDKIDLFKDKVRFRDLLEPIYPGFFYKEIALNKIDDLNLTGLPFPFIIKPAVGFFSLGVYKVDRPENWPETKGKIKKEVALIRQVYPKEVLDSERFIIEENIRGTEFAFDAYFNSHGEPVILSILNHVFASENDVSDRLYISSKTIIETYLEPFTEFLKQLGKLSALKNFPLHVEVRVNDSGKIQPIEINPLRTGGWCTTADMTWFSFGFNPYEYIFKGIKPDWSSILKNKEGKIFSNIVLTNSTGYNVSEIKSFDYEKFKSHFVNPLELRKANFKEYLMFGFLFAETPEENKAELDWVLHSDLKEFITLE